MSASRPPTLPRPAAAHRRSNLVDYLDPAIALVVSSARAYAASRSVAVFC